MEKVVKRGRPGGASLPEASQPAQVGLFWQNVAENDQHRRVKPRRTLRFGVRRQGTQDIPLAKPKQLGLGDSDVDREALCREVGAEPLSERAILRIIEGSDASGQRRKTFTIEVHEAVESFFHAAQALGGFDYAVIQLFALLARDPAYVSDNPPGWILNLLAEERALLVEVFADHKDDRRVEPAGPDDGYVEDDDE